MSSLLSKLKALIGASARGPRRYASDKDASRPRTSVSAVPPDVGDARVTEDGQPEAVQEPRVTTAPGSSVYSDPEASPTEDSVPNAKKIEELEDERVIDLLKGKQSGDGKG